MPLITISPDEDELADTFPALIFVILISADDDADRETLSHATDDIFISPEEEALAESDFPNTSLISTSPEEEEESCTDAEFTELSSMSPDDDDFIMTVGADTLASLISPDDDADRERVLLRNSSHVVEEILPDDDTRRFLTNGPLTVIVTPFSRFPIRFPFSAFGRMYSVLLATVTSTQFILSAGPFISITVPLEDSGL